MPNHVPTGIETLRAWLARNNARALWRKRVTNMLDVEGHQINGRILIVCIYGAIDGFDVYVPASTSNDVALTLDGAALTLGCDGCAGLA